MSDTERKRKSDPEREAPRRDPSGAFGDAGRAAFDGLRAASDAWRDVVERGVRMGYRVVEEQIEQGRKVATTVNDQVYGSGRTRDDMREITDRVFTSFAEMTSRWFDMMGSMASGVTVPGASPSASARQVSVAVATGRAAKVTLDLPAGAAELALAVDPLAPAKGSDRLTVTVRDSAAGARLEVGVSADAAAGTYRGQVRERGTGRETGTLQVRLGA